MYAYWSHGTVASGSGRAFSLPWGGYGVLSFNVLTSIGGLSRPC